VLVSDAEMGKQNLDAVFKPYFYDVLRASVPNVIHK